MKNQKGRDRWFRRKDDYDKVTVEEARELLNESKNIKRDVIVIPSTDSLIFYYQGKPFVSIKDNKWERFGTGYDQYFKGDEGQILKDLDKKRGKEAVKDTYKEKLDVILKKIEMGFGTQKERASQQIIAQNNIIGPDKDKDSERYWICGFESAVSQNYFPKSGKKPEVDLIAVNLEEREILLIEYKCQYGALISNKNNIKKHCEDYLDILYGEDDSPNQELSEHIKEESLKAFSLMCKIYEEDENEKIISKLQAKDFELNIGFLITRHPCKDKNDGKGNISKISLNKAKKEGLDDCIRDYAARLEKNPKARAEMERKLKKHIKCIIWDEPEGHILKGWKSFDEWYDWYK